MKRYKDTPWWWYTVIMGIAFVFGLVVVLKSNVGLGAGGFVAALAVGAVVAPFVSVKSFQNSQTQTSRAPGANCGRVLFSIHASETALRPINCVRCLVV